MTRLGGWLSRLRPLSLSAPELWLEPAWAAHPEVIDALRRRDLRPLRLVLDGPRTGLDGALPRAEVLGHLAPAVALRWTGEGLQEALAPLLHAGLESVRWIPPGPADAPPADRVRAVRDGWMRVRHDLRAPSMSQGPLPIELALEVTPLRAVELPSIILAAGVMRPRALRIRVSDGPEPARLEDAIAEAITATRVEAARLRCVLLVTSSSSEGRDGRAPPGQDDAGADRRVWLGSAGTFSRQAGTSWQQLVGRDGPPSLVDALRQAGLLR